MGKKSSLPNCSSPVYGESNRQIRYLSVHLIWRVAGKTVRFVVVLHPNRGRCILMSTDLVLQPLEIIRLYWLRFKIEVSFQQALRTIRTDFAPSELVTAIALRHTFPEFLSDSSQDSIFKKFIIERIELDRAEGLRLVA